MNLRRKTISFRNIPAKFYAYAIFIVLHVALFNINTAEWGDSYRILRASEFIRQGSYPADEKRPPLFSIFTAIRPSQIDAITWGRVVMFIFSTLSLIVFDKLLKIYVKNEKFHFLALIFFILNPVFLYWSIRTMADVPFAFFALLDFYILKKLPDTDLKKDVLLGLICGLAILTRFEGYLLTASVLIGVAFSGKKDELFKKKFSSSLKSIVLLIFQNWKKILILGLTTLLTISPWIIYRNPLKSSYFGEPSDRAYDFKMVWTYYASILYLFGFTSAFYFIFKKLRTASSFLKENVGITTFIVLELFLILLWPAAIPRLFVCLIPFFIIILILCVQDLIESKEKPGVLDIVLPVFLLLFYIGSQYFLKLQFLIPVKNIFALIVFLQVFIMVFTYLKKYNFMKIAIISSMMLWSLSIIFMHKDIYTAIKQAGIYSRDNLSGKVLFNDSASVADWYINYSSPRKNLSGEKQAFMNKSGLGYNDLLESDVMYVITTNEDGISFDRGIEKLGYLKLIESFRYNIGSREFFANIFKFEKGN